MFWQNCEVQVFLSAVHFSIHFCRLEKQAASNSRENLALFDAKLAAAVSALKHHGFTEQLMASGGSPAAVLGALSGTEVGLPDMFSPPMAEIEAAWKSNGETEVKT